MLALALLVLVAGAWSHRLVHDDAFINFRVVDQVFAGHGLVFNQGERVEAFTSPLWLGILLVLQGTLGSIVSIEWLALGTGIALTAAALVIGDLASSRLRRPGTAGLPFGTLLFASLPFTWYWAGSGLENGLTFAWMAISFLMVTTGVRSGRRTPWWAAAIIGLGVLVRPDLLPFSVLLLVAAWLLGTDRSLGGVLRLVAVAFAAPLAYQLFRMGYYASLVPNTALAKNAGGSEWAQGWTYLTDAAKTAGTGMVAVLLLVGSCVQVALAPERRRAALPVGAMVVGAGVHALWVAKVGGDLLPGRFAMPALFALALAGASLPLTDRQAAGAIALVPRFLLALGLLVSAAQCTLGITGSVPSADELFATSFWTRHSNPVVADDNGLLNATGVDIRRHVRAGDDIVKDYPRSATFRGQPGAGTVAVLETIGVAGFIAGPDAHIVDEHGLADPIAARQPDSGIRIGHMKRLDSNTIAARFTATEAGDPPELDDLRAALRCGDLGDLLEATNGELDVGRFLSNVVDAPRLTAMRFPTPIQAGCG